MDSCQQEDEFKAYCEDEGIVIVEPTDPDEDRAKKKITAESDTAENNAASEQLPIQKARATSLELTCSSAERPTNSLCNVVQQLLSSTPPLQTVPNRSLSSHYQNTSQRTLIAPQLSNPLLTSTEVTHTTITSSITETTTAVDIERFDQPSALSNPLLAAVLVNCATVNMISQFVGSCAPVYAGPLHDILNATQNNILSSVLPNLLNNLSSSSGAASTSPTRTVTAAPTISSPTTDVTQAITPTPHTVESHISSKLNDNESSVGNKHIHRPMNGRTKRFKCPIQNCYMTFYSRFNQTEHIRTHTGERPFVCPKSSCRVAFKRRRDLRDHWNMHLLDSPQSNHSPNPELTKPDDDGNQELSEPAEDGFAKSNSGADLKNDSVVDSIGVDRNSDTPNTTDMTEYADQQLVPEKDVRDSLGRFNCPFAGCDKSYARRHRLNRHVSSHTGTGPLHCDHPNCNVRYYSKTDLLRHKQSHIYLSDHSVRRHACPYPNCEKAYSKLNKLKEHIRSHTGERPYVCREPGCGAAFIRLYGVRRHELTHVFGRRCKKTSRPPAPIAPAVTKPSSFSASDCPASTATITTTTTSSSNSFTQSSHPMASLPAQPYVLPIKIEPIAETKVVLVTGGGELSQSCTDAPVPTGAGGTLARALPVIAPKSTVPLYLRPMSPIRGSPGMRRPHVCPYRECGKAFPKLNKLREHICRHTGERPFVCDKCQASFVRMYDLRRHSNIHQRGVGFGAMSRARPLAPRPLESDVVAPAIRNSSTIAITE